MNRSGCRLGCGVWTRVGPRIPQEKKSNLGDLRCGLSPTYDRGKNNHFSYYLGPTQWRRQDLVSGGHDDRGAEGASIEAPSGLGMWRGVRSPAD